MITSFKTLALVLAAAFPAAFSAESLGVSLPSVIGTGNLFGVFVAALTLLTMTTDYRSRKPLRAVSRAGVVAPSKSRLRLAA